MSKSVRAERKVKGCFQTLLRRSRFSSVSPKIDLASGNANVFAISRALRSSDTYLSVTQGYSFVTRWQAGKRNTARTSFYRHSGSCSYMQAERERKLCVYSLKFLAYGSNLCHYATFALL